MAKRSRLAPLRIGWRVFRAASSVVCDGISKRHQHLSMRACREVKANPFSFRVVQNLREKRAQRTCPSRRILNDTCGYAPHIIHAIASHSKLRDLLILAAFPFRPRRLDTTGTISLCCRLNVQIVCVQDQRSHR